jgi:hypothetical protein
MHKMSPFHGKMTKGGSLPLLRGGMSRRQVHPMQMGGGASLKNGLVRTGKLDPDTVRIFRLTDGWLRESGEPLHGTIRKPLPMRPVWADISMTEDTMTWYLPEFDWPESDRPTVEGDPESASEAFFLAYRYAVTHRQSNGVMPLELPIELLHPHDTVMEALFDYSTGE